MANARERSEMISLRARPEEVAMLRALADDSGLPMSAVVWQLVRERHRRVFGRVLGTKKKGARR